MKKYIVLLALVLFPALAMADSTSVNEGVKVHHGTTATGHPYFKASETTQGQGTVLSVNKKTRVVKIRGEQGDTVAVTCGPDIKNFAQIAKGDVVKVKYTETLTVHVEPEGSPQKAAAETNLSTAKPGEKPHATQKDKVTFSGTITAIDTTMATVTVKGPEGHEMILHPSVKENLKKVKVGEIVVFNYTQTTAVSVEVSKK
jgi:translation initiation factor IF-1